MRESDHDCVQPFENFTYISIDLKNFQVFETKSKTEKPIISIEDVYVGFDLWTIIQGKFDIKTIKLSDGKINITQYQDNSFNIVKAFETEKIVDNLEEEFHIDLQKISLRNVDILKTNLADTITLEAFIDEAETRFKKDEVAINMGLDAKFVFNIIKDKDTTFVKNKHFDLSTDFSFHKNTHLLTFEPSSVKLENGLFAMEGSIDIDDDFNMNLEFSGQKPNFDLLIAFAPVDLIPTLEKYDNQGEIFFSTTIKGKSTKGNLPTVEAKFGCKNGFFDNTILEWQRLNK